MIKSFQGKQFKNLQKVQSIKKEPWFKAITFYSFLGCILVKVIFGCDSKHSVYLTSDGSIIENRSLEKEGEEEELDFNDSNSQTNTTRNTRAACGAPLPQHIVFLGDSITQDGHYVAALEDALIAREPKTRFTFHNAGTSGDRLGWRVNDRLAVEVLERDPDLVIVMFGMNDGGYAPLEPEALEAYRRDLLELTYALVPTKVLLAGPTFPDPLGPVLTGREDAPHDPFYPEVMHAYSEAARAVADETGVGFCDLWSPMVTFTEQAREEDERFTLVPDGIHPDLNGGLIIADALLEAIDGPLPDPTLTLPCAQGGAVGRAWLPLYPVRAGVHPRVRARFTARHVQATLRVECLAPGRYALSVDGAPLVELSAEAWAEGVNLMERPEAPWDLAAGPWLDVSEARRLLYAEIIRPAMARAKRAAVGLEAPEDRVEVFRAAYEETYEARAEAARLLDEAASHAGLLEVDLELAPTHKPTHAPGFP